jgi:hypothetical protein
MDEIQSPLKSAYFAMDNACCARMCKAIAAGLESTPIGVVTTPGTKSPKYVAANLLFAERYGLLAGKG